MLPYSSEGISTPPPPSIQTHLLYSLDAVFSSVTVHGVQMQLLGFKGICTSSESGSYSSDGGGGGGNQIAAGKN